MHAVVLLMIFVQILIPPKELRHMVEAVYMMRRIHMYQLCPKSLINVDCLASFF